MKTQTKTMPRAEINNLRYLQGITPDNKEPYLFVGDRRDDGENGEFDMIVHIANENSEPLCGIKYKYGVLKIYKSTWECWSNEVNCSKCGRKFFSIDSF